MVNDRYDFQDMQMEIAREEKMRQQPGESQQRRAGKRGGRRTRKKYGPEFYTVIGKMGGETTKNKLGTEHYRRIGKMGGERGRGTPRQNSRHKPKE